MFKVTFAHHILHIAMVTLFLFAYNGMRWHANGITIGENSGNRFSCRLIVAKCKLSS